jgi:hypothetical protein
LEGVAVYRTGLHGCVRVTTDGSCYSVSTEKGTLLPHRLQDPRLHRGPILQCSPDRPRLLSLHQPHPLSYLQHLKQTLLSRFPVSRRSRPCWGSWWRSWYLQLFPGEITEGPL